jgi:hypothetical protein
MLPHFGGQNEELTKELSNNLLSKGFTFDYISDKQIRKLKFENRQIQSGNVAFKTVLVPAYNLIPLETMQHLIDLADAGATIVFEDKIPGDVPGMANLEARQKEYKNLVKSLNFHEENGFSIAKTGAGKVVTGKNIVGILNDLGIYEEALAEAGLWFNRVNRPEGVCYFISNWSGKEFNKWVTIQSSGKTAAMFNPMNEKVGKANIKGKNKNQADVYLQLKPGETLVLQWYDAPIEMDNYPVLQSTNEKIILNNEWEISFVKGIPVLPNTYKTNQLQSWTKQSDELKKFSGTASYKTNFEKPTGQATAWLLDLGQVHESAVVYLNGEKLETLIGPVYQLTINQDLLKDTNELEIQVTNLMANAMIDLEKRGVNYKKFYNINFAARKKENLGPDGIFTAINWEPLESGLIGPVSLTGLVTLNVK